MRAVIKNLLVLAAMVYVSPSQAAKNQFNEYCSPTKTKVSNSQALWSCTYRNYESIAQLYSDLEDKNPRSTWQSPFWRKDEPVLINLQGKEFFWDCVPNKDTCGIWVKITPTQLVFIQQLLDRQRNNMWLGVGLTLFCEGPTDICRSAQEKIASVLPSTDLNYTSLVGRPPPAPPMPPRPPRPFP